MTTYGIGIDIGGTFTDAAAIDGDGRITTGKAPSTPHDFSQGFFNALEDVASQLELSLDDLLGSTGSLVHATTTGSNAVVERKGSTVGFIATRGHGETLAIMRGGGRSKGLDVDELLYLPGSTKPPPLVEPELIREVNERIDCQGNVVVPLAESEVREAIRSLLDAGAETIAVGLLWSIVNPEHELRVRAIAEEVAPGTFVSCSHEITPQVGEYYRFVATVLNSYLGLIVADYVGHIADRTAERGYTKPVLMAQCMGGVAPADETKRTPLFTLDSGPVSGVVAANYIATACGYPNVITADMGGTTFDVSVVAENTPRFRPSTNIRKFEMYLPMVDVQSIGAGGGSIAWLDPSSATMKVGPQSAGAEPGPICYAQGGEKPTVTDADVVLGIINPDRFLGGRQRLDADAALEGISRLGSELGLRSERTAAGIVEIIDNLMAEKIRRMCTFQGHDLREFAIIAFGGAAPAHAGAVARQLGVKSVVIPMGNIASVLSALGTISSDVRHVYDQPARLSAPFDMDKLAGDFDSLEQRARHQLAAERFKDADTHLERVVSMKYGAQVFSIEVPAEPSDSSEDLVARFESIYEERFGKGSGYAPAGIQIMSERIVATGQLPRPTLTKDGGDRGAASSSRAIDSRRIYWSEAEDYVDTAIYDEHPGTEVSGPAVVELPHTTIAVRPGQSLSLDGFGNLILSTQPDKHDEKG